MTFETISGIFVIISSLLSVLTAVTKINRAIVALEEAVKRLDEFARTQMKTNESYNARICECERRMSAETNGGAR